MNAVSTSDAKKTLLKLLEDSLAAEEREALEREFFEEDDLFEALLAAEDDLVDDFASGRLSAEARAMFERRPELIPGLETRVALSSTLGRLAADQNAEKPDQTRFAPRSRPRRRVLSWLAAAAVLVLAVGPWLRSQSGPGVTSGAPTTWVIGASSARGGVLPQLHLPPGSGSVTLILELDRPLSGATAGRLHGTLTDGRGEMRDLGSTLHVETFPWGTGVEVVIPMETWQPGLQTLELSVARADATAEPVATYRFELLRG